MGNTTSVEKVQIDSGEIVGGICMATIMFLLGAPVIAIIGAGIIVGGLVKLGFY